MTRDCPDCEQGKHRGCLMSVLVDTIDGDDWVPCPCMVRNHQEET